MHGLALKETLCFVFKMRGVWEGKGREARLRYST